MSADSTAIGDDLLDQRNENDTELRELVYQSLERDGLITRLKAQLRAAVFKTIEKASNPSNGTHTPGYEGTTGRICRALVLDWLEQSRLLYTHDVFKVETSGPNHPSPLTHSELVEELHLDTVQNRSQPILHVLLNQSNNRVERVTSLPDHIKQSIDMKFSGEKINDINRVREHFRSLFSPAFDTTVLEAFLNKTLSHSSTSMAKMDYEQICLKWLQACNQALTSQTSPMKPNSPVTQIQPLSARNGTNNGQITTRARRSTSPPSESNSSSISTSSSENPRKHVYDFQLPTTQDLNKNGAKKSSDILPPPLLNFNNNSANDDDDDTTSSLFSRRNATPAVLNRLKNIEDIIGGGGGDDETPRTRTTIQKTSTNGNKDIPIEYDDESMSQISSIDDVTVDKASPSPSAHIDFLEDL
ncbi:unnamed protein product [Adineta ricciae]|uniref:LisH domain-containing protein n=1 Tax=Adineta ricciae TaxID=249248 RepID=A0A815D1Q3_ADIRI|nr:unnamed protein product [Adineta ricciae]CAF1292558.1 unnamed protein product [Adineta ricciae]